MVQRFMRLVAVCLVLCIVLSGCSLIDSSGRFSGLLGSITSVRYDQMQYTRPDMDEHQRILDESCEQALVEENLNLLLDAIMDYYEVYDSFCTNFFLAMIAYCRDTTDIYWQGEYGYCNTHAAEIDAGLDRLYRCLAKSPLRQELEGEDYFGADYFDSYEGEGLYDETFTALLSQEAALVNSYFAISSQANAVEYYSEDYFSIYGSQMAQVFLELVQLRQQIATYAGYTEYTQFAYDFYHVRDYTPEQATAYLADVRAELVPLYRRLSDSDVWSQGSALSLEADTFHYVQSMANAMGGKVKDAFQAMNRQNLYDISYGQNKQGTSFTVYLRDYQLPYLFVTPTLTQYDCLSFAHEFGHFCNEYVSYGSMVGVDVAEIFSMSMEYLSLCYAESGDALTRLKMADSLNTFITQAAFASFEHQLYSLSGDDLTVEGIQQLYTRVCTAYGLDVQGWDSREYVCIPHFVESPMYIISYVVSNDVALQVYQKEQQQTGAGLSIIQDNLGSSDAYLLTFVTNAGLESPFDQGRLLQVRQTLEKALEAYLN